MPEDSPESIFTPFEPSAETPTSAQPPTRQRKQKPVPAKTSATRPEPKPARKPRKPRTVPKVRVPRGLRFTLAESLAIMDALKAEDAAVFEKIVGILGGANKKQRARVMAALRKVFG